MKVGSVHLNSPAALQECDRLNNANSYTRAWYVEREADVLGKRLT